MPRPGQVLGLVGTNGIGKSTALKILAGKLKPNLGRFGSPPDWEEILAYFRGSELQVREGGVLEGGYVPHTPAASTERSVQQPAPIRRGAVTAAVACCRLSPLCRQSQ